MSGEASAITLGGAGPAAGTGADPFSLQFRTFFEMMDEGVCLLEKVATAPGELADFRYVAANPAFSVQSGIADVVGKTIRQVVPGESEEWFQTYNKVLETGVPVRFERELITQGRFLEVSVSLAGEEGHRLLAIVFKDATARDRAEKRDAFLVQVDDAIRPLTDPNQITYTAARLLTLYLGASRCVYAEIADDQDTFQITGDYVRDVPTVVGRFSLKQFGEECVRCLLGGAPYVVEDSETAPMTEEVRRAYRQILVRSEVSVPLLKHGKLAAGVAVHQSTPRKWRSDEIELVQQIAARCWESIERAKTLRALVEREQRYRFLAESIPQMVWTATPDGLLDYVNERVTEYFDAAAEDVLGGAWLNWVHPEDQERSIERWRKSLAAGENYESTFRLKFAKDGSWRWHLVRAHPYLDKNGQVLQWFGTCTDIEDQKRADAELERQWRTFDTALSHTPDFVYIFDLEGRFTYVNKALLSLWQKPLEEAVGKNFFELGYPEDLAARLQRQIQEVVEGRHLVRDHTPFTGPTGETRHYEYIFLPILRPDGQIQAVAGATRDITDRERIEQALAANEEKLQQVFKQAPVAIIVFRGEDFLVELANPYYQELLGGRELTGRPFAESVPELEPVVWNALKGVLETGDPFIATDFFVPYNKVPGGVLEDHWFNVAYNPIREPDGSVSGVIAVCSDVTEQVRARRELERVNRELEEFAFVSSHDLQEPLRMVNIYTQLLLRRFAMDDEDARLFAGFITQGVKRMETLIRDLLTYSRAVQKDEAPVGTTDLSAALDESISVLMNRIEETGAVITADVLPTVYGETMQLEHVFQNLLSNALKYRKPDVRPQIHVSLTEEKQRWVIVVRDNGIGFDQQYAERIFGLFKRLHKDEYPGTGLGLAICQRIVERYGGKMWAESSPGQGSTFSFALPRIEV